MKTNKLGAILLAMVLSTTLLHAQTTAQWASDNNDALVAAADPAGLTTLLQQGQPALDKLFAAIQTDGKADPVASVRLAALSQYVMQREGAKFRQLYATALLTAAQKSSQGDVICIFLDQLRWCGLPAQAAAIKAFEKSDKPGVAEFAPIVYNAVTDGFGERPAPATLTPAAKLNQELAKLKSKALLNRMIQAFDGPDNVLAGTALAYARNSGGKSETTAWAAKLATTTSAERKIMLVDMLGCRGDKAASAAIASLLNDGNTGIADAAQRALIKIDSKAFAAQLPTLLKALPETTQNLTRNNLRTLPTDLLKQPLTASYNDFSAPGKVVALELIRDRKISEGAKLGLDALGSDDADAVIAGWRLLREIAGKEQATILAEKMIATKGRITPEAQRTFADAGRRDTSGTYAAALLKVINSTSGEQKAVAIETAARIGGKTLLAAIDQTALSADTPAAAAAARALSNWPDASSLPALLQTAALATDSRAQALALRGFTQKLEANPNEATAIKKLWTTLKPKVKDEELKKRIDGFTTIEVNVARGCKVETDVKTEGNFLPEYLTDGTLEKAWHGATTPANAIVDLGAVKNLKAMHVTFYHQDGRAYTFELSVSEDKNNWKKVAGNTDNPQRATADGLRIDFEPTKARYARLTVIKNSANPAVHVLELKLYEAD